MPNIAQTPVPNSSKVDGQGTYYVATTGTGSPNGTLTANVGRLYVDTSNGNFFVKQWGTTSSGWAQVR